MARKIEVVVKGDTKQLDRDIQSAADAGGRNMRQLKSAIDSTNTSLGAMRSALSAVQGAFAALGVVAAARIFENFGRAAVDAAVSIDKQVNSLKALTGSAEVAQKRFQELFKIAQATPGLTTSLATALDTQLRIFRVNEQTINKLLPVIGRLNAVSPLDDPRQLVNNLTQLITQKFDQQDLKELLRQSPIAAQLVAQIFNVDNPTNAEAIRNAAKKLGITTVARLAEELIKAAENSSALKNATESIGGQFEKLQDRVTVALAPIGEQIAKVISPAVQDLVKQFEQNGPIVTNIIRSNALEMQGFELAITATIDKASRLIGVFSGLDQKGGLIRNFLLLATAVGNPTQINLLKSIFNQIDAQREAQANRLFPGGGSGSPLLVNARGTVTDINGKVLGKSDDGGGTGGNTGGGASDSQRRSARERVERFLSRVSISGLQDRTETRLRDLETATHELIKTYEGEIKAREKYIKALEDLGFATTSMVSKGFSNLVRNGTREFNDANRDSSRSYNLQLQSIDDLFNRGAINPSEAEALRRQAALQRASALNSNLNGPNAKFIDRDDIQNLRDEAEHMTRLGTAVSNTERFMRGFNSAIETTGDAFERLGQNIANSFRDVSSLLSNLKNSILSFFNDLLGQSLQRVFGQILAPIAGLFGGGGGFALPGGGNLFRTPSFAGGLQSIASAFAGSGISAPASITQAAGGFFNPGSIGSSGGIGGARASHEAFQVGIAGAAASKFSFGALGKSLGNLAPLLGLSLGSGVGGQSTAGNILGSLGGLGAGIGISSLIAGASVPGAFGSVLGLSSIAGPIGLAAAPLLLIGASLLGKAAQRRKDEEASGQYLTQALQAIDQLAAGVQSGAIDGSQASAIFENQILAQFRQQISGLKTKSVVESRLKNQVADLRKVYEARIPPLIAEQQRKAADAQRFAAIDSRLVPQFDTGGISRGGLAFLHDREMVLTPRHQAAIAARAGQDIFRDVGVPGVQPNARFDNGGIFAGSSDSSRGPATIVIDTLFVGIDAEGIFVEGGSGPAGEQVVFRHIENVRLRKGRRG